MKTKIAFRCAIYHTYLHLLLMHKTVREKTPRAQTSMSRVAHCGPEQTLRRHSPKSPERGKTIERSIEKS